jgi:NAD(P)H-hydrate epimerase
MSDTSYKLYTAGQVRGIDYAAIHELGIAGYELMKRAGKAVLDDARNRFPSAGHWLIICGGGNNGGDGYVVARLAVDAGIKVTVCSLVEPERLKGDAAKAYSDWQGSGGRTGNWPLSDDSSFDLAMDALLGTGIDRAVEGRFREAIVFLNQLPCPKYAIDIPSGLNADTGAVMGGAVRAQNTMTFVGRKRGMYTADGPDFCGHIGFDDLDIPSAAADSCAETAGELLSLDSLAGLLKPRSRNSHKGSYGHVFAVGGLKGMSGAIRLCGEAALRSGAGRVTLATDPAHATLVNLSRPELMVKAVASGDELPSILNGSQVIAVGPGLGLTDWSESLLRTCLGTQATLVVDADALNLLARQSHKNSVRRENWILTPHPAEAARLLDCEVSEIQKDRVFAAVNIAQRYGASVVLKGCGSVIAEPSGNYAICPLGNPGMATAGSGDVLTGIIAALVGQGLSCFAAAKAGVVAHSAAGDLAADNVGEMALIAGDIIDHLPGVWKSAGT